MSIINIVIGVAIGVLCGIVIIALRNRQRDVFSVLLVAGVVALAAAVTIVSVHQYQVQKQARTAAAADLVTSPAVSGSSTPPARPPVLLPTAGPLMRGPTGGAAPEAAKNPYLGAGGPR